MTYRELYEKGKSVLATAGIDEAELDARLLLEFVCGTDRNTLLVHGDRDVTPQEEADYICGRKQDVLYPQIYREDWNLTEGVNTLNGEQALIHARNRSIGNNDYRRTERQREVIQGAFEKIKDADLKTVLSYVEKGFSMITTDMSKGEIAGYLMKGMLLGITEAESIRIPQDGASTSKTINGMQVLVPDLELCREYLKENI